MPERKKLEQGVKKLVDVKRLRGLIAEAKMSQAQVAKKIGVSENTFYSKMRTGKFYVYEAKRISEVLCIEHPEEIFFADKFA